MKNVNYKTYTICIAVALSVLLFPSRRLEASSNDAFLNRFQGTWQGDGKAFGMSARLHMKWERVLAGKFLYLILKTETQTATGQVQAFEGHAYYWSTGEGKCDGEWFDTRGESFSIKGNIEGETLNVLWGAPRGEQGKSVYRFLEAGKLEVVDSVRQKDGTWREFGRFVVIRQ
ncbi:MAG: hypothetical protein ND866_00260 [Pyrinomonadaceae bacterium]|nr:hypothetical protein [Pyrinomonadaceae bacterium]